MRGRRAADPEYYRKASRESYLKNKGTYLARAVIRARLKRTGVDNDTYLNLLALQGGKCALCFTPIVGRNCHTDHCHDTKRPRGLLCSACNQAEGLIRRSGLAPEEFGRRLSLYLAHPPAESL
jgi:hypothetical protein